MRHDRIVIAASLALVAAIVVCTLEAARPASLKAAADSGRSTATKHSDEQTARAETNEHVRLAEALRRKAALLARELGDDCAVVVRSPFVIAGDMTKARLDRWHRDTIAPAAEALANLYFDVPPSQPITVLLFTGEESYNRFAKQLYGDENVSVYGYYKPDKRTLVMNIATGGGTLVHELTHALMAFDFPDVPDWFNEGLASLYEQCQFGEKNGRRTIEGLVNWRLPKLQQSIRDEKLGSLESLFTADDFRGRNVGLNYAQARYFCMYLQQQGLLADYYRAFRDNRKEDPQGVRAAEQVLGEAWKAIDSDFRAWVLLLKK
jgi:hypothetical protein